MEQELGTAGVAGPEMQSPTIGELAKALAAAQALIKAPKKGREAKIPTKDGGEYRYAYADLADVIESYREPLSKHGLALVQPIIQRDGHLVLVTKILHTSGEWIASEFPLRAYDKPQEQGSAITYARRYTVSALLGIAAEDDDDGQRAQNAKPAVPQAASVNGDAATLLEVAAELAQVTGMDADTLVHEASSFTGDDGKVKAFTGRDLEAGRVRSAKWIKSTLSKLEKELQAKGAMAAVGEADVPF